MRTVARLGINWAGIDYGDDKDRRRGEGGGSRMTTTRRSSLSTSIWIKVLIGLSTVVIVATGQHQHGADTSGGVGGQTGQ